MQACFALSLREKLRLCIEDSSCHAICASIRLRMVYMAKVAVLRRRPAGMLSLFLRGTCRKASDKYGEAEVSSAPDLPR